MELIKPTEPPGSEQCLITAKAGNQGYGINHVLYVALEDWTAQLNIPQCWCVPSVLSLAAGCESPKRKWNNLERSENNNNHNFSLFIVSMCPVELETINLLLLMVSLETQDTYSIDVVP